METFIKFRVTPFVAVDTDKILTIPLRYYCKSKGKELSDYVIKRVHSFETINCYSKTRDSPKHKLIFYEANGDALFPKKS